MLIVPEQTREHFLSVVKFAVENGVIAQLLEQLWYLHTYAVHEQVDHTNRTVTLFKDFAPQSFGLLWKSGEHVYMNGGLIYQGPTCPADGSFPSLTVNIGDPTKVGWFVHT